MPNIQSLAVVSPSNSAAGSDWVTEEVFNALNKSADPKAAWRKSLAVWPDWNPNGQFVVYELKAGEQLKVWRGPASAQIKKDFPDHYLEGGCEQIKFNAAFDYDAKGVARQGSKADDLEYYSVNQDTGAMSKSDMTYSKWKTLPPDEQAKYASLRLKINNGRIVGPLDTKWGTTDFDSQLDMSRLGLPNLPGQVVNR